MHSFQEIQDTIFNFEELLTKHGLTIDSNSELNKICINASTLQDVYSGKYSFDEYEELPEYLSEAMGLYDFASKLLSIEKKHSFDSFVPHLDLLNKGSVPQNVRSKITDSSSNKLFELYLASLLIHIGEDIELDHPQNAKGDNPDILITIKDRRWGFACKAVHSPKEKSIFQNIEKACKQIAASEAEVGIPVINMKNVIDHNALWPLLNESQVNSGEHPIWGTFFDANDASKILQAYVLELREKYQTDEWATEFEILFASKKNVLPAVVFVLQAGCSILMDGQPFPSKLNVMSILPFGKLDGADSDVIHNLNEMMQNI